MNFTNFATAESITNGCIGHIRLLVIIAIITPLFYYFGLKKELKFIEQIIAVLAVFISIEVCIFVIPFLIDSIKSLF